MRIKQLKMEMKMQSWISFLILSVAREALSRQNTNLIPCEKGWYLFGDKCYKVFATSKGKTWKSAEDSCVAHHGSLVTIQSQELQVFLSKFLLLDVPSDKIWIGLNDLVAESRFAWSDGSVINYTNWYSGQPDNYYYKGDDEDCVEMIYRKDTIAAGWNDNNCNHKQPFMCQTNKSNQSMNHDPRFCTGENDGAWKYQDSCYHTVSEEMSWDDAESYCQTTLKGHLLTILDNEALLFLNYTLSDFKTDFWIGIKFRDAAQQMWSSEWIADFTKLDRGHKYEAGTCAYMTEKGLWLSAPCSRKLPFVCEVQQVKPKKAAEGWRCPGISEDWEDLGGDNCYIFETEQKKNWHEAYFACLKKGGHLAIINSVEEQNDIHRRVRGRHGTMLIGLHRSLSNNSVFEWEDGTVIDYQNWGLNEPSDVKEACGEIWKSNMKWNDISCDTKKEYICSAKKVPSFDNETAWTDRQRLENYSCSGYASSNIALALLLVAVIISVVGFTIYVYRNQYSVSFQRWKHFATSFSERNGTASSKLVPNELGLIID